MISGRLLPESTGSWQESSGKYPHNFWSEYFFHVPAISGDFLASFLQDYAGSGSRNHRPGTFYSNLDDEDEQKSYIICLTSDGTKCDKIFEDKITKDGLYIIFNHLYARHAEPYKYIAGNFFDWCYEKRVSDLALSKKSTFIWKDFEWKK